MIATKGLKRRPYTNDTRSKKRPCLEFFIYSYSLHLKWVRHFMLTIRLTDLLWECTWYFRTCTWGLPNTPNLTFCQPATFSPKCSFSVGPKLASVLLKPNLLRPIRLQKFDVGAMFEWFPILNVLPSFLHEGDISPSWAYENCPLCVRNKKTHLR